jgi:hypothetical protein
MRLTTTDAALIAAASCARPAPTILSRTSLRSDPALPRPRRPHQRVRAGRLEAQVRTGSRVLEPHSHDPGCGDAHPWMARRSVRLLAGPRLPDTVIGLRVRPGSPRVRVVRLSTRAWSRKGEAKELKPRREGEDLLGDRRAAQTRPAAGLLNRDRPPGHQRATLGEGVASGPVVSEKERCSWVTIQRPPALVLRVQRAEPVGVEVADHIAARSSLVNATFAIKVASMPWAGSKTICARRQFTTDPLPRRTIRTSRWPSSSSISRTRSRSLTGPVSAISARGGSTGGQT